MKKETLQKIHSCKALQGKTVMDVVAMPRFSENLAAYWQAQKADREAIRRSYDAMHKLGGVKGFKIPAHVIDDIINLSVDDIAVEYGKVLCGRCTRNAAERKYIRQIGQQAYNLTIAQIIVEEFPELGPELLPKQKTN